MPAFPCRGGLVRTRSGGWPLPRHMAGSPRLLSPLGSRCPSAAGVNRSEVWETQDQKSRKGDGSCRGRGRGAQWEGGSPPGAGCPRAPPPCSSAHPKSQMAAAGVHTGIARGGGQDTVLGSACSSSSSSSPHNSWLVGQIRLGGCWAGSAPPCVLPI